MNRRNSIVRGKSWTSIVLASSLGLAGWGTSNASFVAAAEPEQPASAQAGPTKPAASTPAPKLDVEVVALLRRTALALESRSIEPEEQAGFRALITAGDLLREDKTLAPSERERLRALCRVRLAQAEDVLKRQTAKQEAAEKASEGRKKIVARNAVLKRPATIDAPANVNGKPDPILAQQFPGGAGFGGQNGGAGAMGNAGATRASAEDLMEIITSSIKPESWDVNGGTGVIRYFSIGHALVIRATADTHGGLADLVARLRN